MHMNWGKGIVLSFVLFAAFVFGLVTICVRQHVNLVSKDYYQNELHYQERIDRLNNTADLAARPTIEFSDNRLIVDFKSRVGIEQGEIQMFRPSDVSLDKKFRLDASSERIRFFDLTDMHRGMYKVLMSWSVDGKEFYLEETIKL